MHKIIMLNGPPRCGKDTAARFLQKKYGFGNMREYKMSLPLKQAFQGFFGLTVAESKVYLEDKKDEICSELGIMCTPRQWQITFSEDFMKPSYGEDVFGQIASRRLVRPTSYTSTVISDIGFVKEAEVLVRHFGKKNCFVVNIGRPEHTFEGDSRSLVVPHELDIAGKFINNCYGKDLYEVQVLDAVEKFMKGPET